ncbi:ATP-NAD kinase family protein [Candidatus Poribacteria bacterium]|nr:ATP-NAD kinase family protein [Candidatus Poribacteria bacterium]
MKKLGVVVNPIAGMGGRVGLKGTDGTEILGQARQLGAQPESPQKAIEALKVIARLKDHIEVIAYPSEMGENECRSAGFNPTVVGAISSGETTSRDTQRAAKEMAAAGVSLLLFAGGDGTARNICDAIGESAPALGVPAGVKIHSAVYAVSPKSAGEVAAMFLDGRLKNTRSAEVMDIDEDAFRNGVVAARLYGYLTVPDERRFIQSVKSGAIVSEQRALHGIADDVISEMNDECFYIIGPGTTTRVIMDRLGLRNTLLGIDVIGNKRLIANDVTESQLIGLVKGHKAKIIVTIIGGQGHVFGRGNQQISPRVIREVGKENIIVIATKEKLISLSGRPLLVDTGDEALDQELKGYVRVVTGYRDYVMHKVGY